MILPLGCSLGAAPSVWVELPTPNTCSASGLAIMMQLARELKTLAKEFSVAVVVSAAVPAMAGSPGLGAPGAAAWADWLEGMAW